MGIKRSAKDGSDAPALSLSVETKLVDTLFEQQGSMVLGQTATIFVGALAYAESRAPGILAWIVVTVAITPWRLNLARAYTKRPPTDALKSWTDRFALGAVISALGFALVGSFAVLRLDNFVQLILVSGQCAFVTGAAARNCAMPDVARVQVILPLGASAAAYLATGQLFSMSYAVLLVMYLLGILEIVRFMALRTRNMFVAQGEAERANAMLEALATTDPLTGAVNRRGFETVLTREFETASSHRRPFALLMLDIDHFKAVNDVHGHQGGDECLRLVAKCMREIVCRPGDIVARYGGEEFAILLPGMDETGALATADRVRTAVEALAIRHPTSVSAVTTISIGYSVILHGGSDDCAALIRRADNALYRAKSTGRNRVVGPLSPSEERLDPGMRSAAEAA